MGRRRSTFATYERAHQAALRQAQRTREAQARAEREERVRWAIAQAEQDSRAVEAKVETIEQLLAEGVRRAGQLDFRTAIDLPPAPQLSLDHLEAAQPEPELHTFLPREHGLLDALIPGARQRHAARLEQATARYAEAQREYAQREARRRASVEEAEQQHRLRQATWEHDVAQRRAAAAALQQRLLAGEGSAVEQAARMVLERSAYPPGFTKKGTLTYSEPLRLISVESELMGSAIVPEIAGYTYVRTRDEIKPKQRSDAQRKQIYTSYIAAAALRAVHELFAALPFGVVERVRFNGSVAGTDRARGVSNAFCLVSLDVSRDEFRRLALAQVDPASCLLGLGGRVSRNALALSPVEPISIQTGRIAPRAQAAPSVGAAVRQHDANGLIDGRYRVIARLGKGAFGAVLRVQDQHLQREVALKQLHEHLADEQEDRRRFIQEARALASVNHPYVVHVYDVNEQAYPPFFTMEYIPGISLAQALAPRIGLPLPRLMEITRKVCEALDRVHQLHLIHRDIKADNIMLTQEGEPRLMDFGIALADGQTRLTGVGYGLGTPESAAPEQIGGRAVTNAVDIYALGILVFHMATGRRPFEGDITHVLYAQANTMPPTLLSLRPDAGVALSNAVGAALAKRPEQRPASAGSFWRMAAGRL